MRERCGAEASATAASADADTAAGERPAGCRRGDLRRRRRASPSRSAVSRAPPREFRCRLDRDGRQRFNFAQHVWLDPDVPMACTRSVSIALQTLAVNVLTQTLTADRKGPARNRLSHRMLIRLARAFSEECLLGAPERGWIIPRATVSAWLLTRGCRLRATGSR